MFSSGVRQRDAPGRTASVRWERNTIAREPTGRPRINTERRTEPIDERAVGAATTLGLDLGLPAFSDEATKDLARGCLWDFG